MKRLLIVLAMAISAQAGDREFRDIVGVISSEFHTRPMRVPMFGLVNLVVAVAHPAGAKHIDLAIFEDLPSRVGTGNLLTSLKSAVGGSWAPFVQVHSTRGGHEETVLVYLRQHGKDWKLLVT